MVSTFNNRPTAVCETESRVEGYGSPTDTIKVIWKPPSVAEDRNRQERRQSKADQEAKSNVEKSRRPKPKILSRTHFVKTKQQVQGNTSGSH